MNVYCLFLIIGKCQKNALLGKRGRREGISVSQDGGLIGGLAAFSKGQALFWKMKFLQPPPSAYGWCIEADSLWPVCRQKTRNSCRSACPFTQKSCLHTTQMCMHTHTVLFFHQLFGGDTRVIFILRFGCADWVSFWRKDESLGVVATIQHCTPSYWVFIWVAFRSQGTAFWFSKKAMQSCLILLYVKCTDCFMNHYSLLIHCLNKVWTAIQPVKYFAVSKGCLICERGLDSFYNIPSLQLISFEVPGFL